jgi:hypothetical protein
LKSKAKDPAAVALGRAGGTARAAKLSKAQRKASAKNAAEARWKGHTPKRKQHTVTIRNSELLTDALERTASKLRERVEAAFRQAVTPKRKKVKD